MSQIIFPIFILLLLVGGEYYLFQAIKLIYPAQSDQRFSLQTWIYLGFNCSIWLGAICFRLYASNLHLKPFLPYLTSLFIALILVKIIVCLFLFGGDIYRFILYLFQKANTPEVSEGTKISRSAFLSKVALGVASVPFVSLVYGMMANAYNYQIRKVSIAFPNLPAGFDGFKIVQISDIHSGSFNQTAPLIHAVKMINDLQADIVLFTGDLVNSRASEMIPYLEIFNKITAKNGVLSVTGNHDYGDYVEWDSKEEKIANFEALKETHAKMGWKLLMNENHILAKGEDKIAILGIENWGHALRFPRYGKMKEAIQGTEEIPFKLLMSHDPSHWDAQVRPEYGDIDLMLSGHTHGFQFGIETKYFKWSPSQFVYKQWAGLYQEGKQYIYVNRGFGFLGYPGRVGILPEITEITLRKA